VPRGHEGRIWERREGFSAANQCWRVRDDRSLVHL